MKLRERFRLAWLAFMSGPAEIVNETGVTLHSWCEGRLDQHAHFDIMRVWPGVKMILQEGPRPIEILKTGDSIGELSAVLQHPDGTVRRVTFDADRPVTVPAPFRVVQVGHIGSNVKLDSPNDSPGALIAQALRRFNDNVGRFAQFKATVSDEVNSTDQAVKASTVWVAFGADDKRHRFQITVERTDQEPPEMARRTPLVISEGR